MIEREKLICCLVGRYSALNPNISGKDLQISIDQHLLKCNMLPLGKDDTDLLEQLLGETIISILLQGINRKTRRNV